MKFIRFFLGVCVITGFLPFVHGAYGRTACNAGTYNYSKASGCTGCPVNCYCKGHGKGPWSGHKITECKPGDSYPVKRAGNNNDVKDNFDNLGVYACPIDFPNSDKTAESIEKCYQMFNGVKFYHIARGCEVGYYIPAGTQSKDVTKAPCLPCKSGYKCPGFSYAYVSPTEDVGIYECGANQISSSDKKTCVDCTDGKKPDDTKTKCVYPIKCVAGTYLPANSSSCAACPEGYVCQGNNFGQQPIDQGKRKCSGNTIPNEQRTNCVSCPAGKKANEGNTECVDAEIFVPAGKYLPANRVQPADCIGDTKYCPGGYYMKKSVEQGRFDCPYGSRFTNNHKQCSLKLTKENMQYGPLGTESAVPCWMITNEVAYKDCVFGAKNDD